MPKFKFFDTCHVDLDRESYWYSVGRLREGTIAWERTGGWRSSGRTWKTLRGAENHANGMELQPGDLAIVVVIEGLNLSPSIKIIKAVTGRGLNPGDAFKRSNWSFKVAEGGWDIV